MMQYLPTPGVARKNKLRTDENEKFASGEHAEPLTKIFNKVYK